jgi:DNA-binding GntR family transcriptional regulator
MGDIPSSLSSLPKVRARTRLSETTAAIRQIVLDGVVPTGGRLKDQELAQALGVSRATVREAARELVHEGILVHEPYKGLRVANVDDQGWLDLAEVRAALETLAAQRVARSLTPEMDAQLESALREIAVADASGDVASINETHSALHELIQHLSGNPMLEKTWDSIGRRARAVIRVDYEVDPTRDRVESHRSLVRAIRSHDPEVIAKEVESHVLQSARDSIHLRHEQPGALPGHRDVERRPRRRGKPGASSQG